LAVILPQQAQALRRDKERVMIGHHRDHRPAELWMCALSMAAVSAPVALAWAWFLLHR
jgi:hypothetical protein